MKVFFLNDASKNEAIGDLSLRLDKVEKHSLDYAPWAAYPYKPRIRFAMAYDAQRIYLKYYVEENFIKAANGQINAPVYQDTCVEFFVLFDDTGYYNLEFNCTGTALVGFGKAREGRRLLPEEIIRKIRYLAVIRNQDVNTVHWELTLAIPLEVFIHHGPISLRGKKVRGNFYKCGDRLPEPHYLAWSNIQSPEPDFHRPEFFGTLVFE